MLNFWYSPFFNGTSKEGRENLKCYKEFLVKMAKVHTKQERKMLAIES